MRMTEEGFIAMMEAKKQDAQKEIKSLQKAISQAAESSMYGPGIARWAAELAVQHERLTMVRDVLRSMPRKGHAYSYICCRPTASQGGPIPKMEAESELDLAEKLARSLKAKGSWGVWNLYIFAGEPGKSDTVKWEIKVDPMTGWHVEAMG